MRFEGRVNPTSLARVRTALVSTPSRVFPVMKREMQRVGADWERAMGKRFSSSGPLHARSGALSRSMSSDVSGTSLNDLKLRCFSQGPNYTRPQEYGAEIKPKNKRALTVPLTRPGDFNRKGASGEAKYPSVALLISAYGKDRVFRLDRPGKSPLICLKDVTARSTANGVRFNRKAAGGITPMFVLLKSVTLPGPKTTGTPSRLGFFDEFNRLDARNRIIKAVSAALGRTA